MFGRADSIYFDGHKDTTLATDNVDRKYYHQTNFEEHDVVGEPGKFYLINVAHKMERESKLNDSQPVARFQKVSYPNFPMLP